MIHYTDKGREPRLRKLRDRHMLLGELASELAINPELWNTKRMRTAWDISPHREIDDIWVRHNTQDGFSIDYSRASKNDIDKILKFNEEHESVWYPEAAFLPTIKDLCREFMYELGGERLGGVLITRVPAGKQVYPHFDTGWHAEYYDTKVYAQVRGNHKQCFHYKDENIRTLTGEVFTFTNQEEHWVTNNSDEDRVTLIVSVKTGL